MADGAAAFQAKSPTILEDCDWFAGTVLTRTDLGDHTGFLLAPTRGHVDATRGGQLGYSGADDIDAGQPAGPEPAD